MYSACDGLRAAAAVVAGDVGRQHGLFAIEPENLRIGDQVVAVLVMAAIAHVTAHLVQQPRHVQQEPVPRAQAVVGANLVEQPQGHVGHRLGMTEIDVILPGDRHRRVDHAGGQRPVFFPRDPVGKLQQQPVAHRHARNDDVLGLGQAEQVLVDQQGRIDGLGLGKGDAEALGQVLRRPMLATRDQLVELLRIDAVQVGRIGRLADLADGEAGVAADRDERFDVVQRHRILQRSQHGGNLVTKDLGHLLGRVLVVGQHLVQPHGTQPQALRSDDLPVAEQGQQRAAAADVGDERLAPA